MLAAALAVLALSGPIAYSNTAGDLLASTAPASTRPGAEARAIFTADGATSLQSLVVTPDGKSVLALASGDEPGLVLVPLGGGPPKPIAGTDEADAGSVSPDGRTVVFSAADGIYSVAVSGGKPKQLLATPDGATDSLPQYSPDGGQVAFARDELDGDGDETVTLELMPARGGAVVPRATGLISTLARGGRISWSPDGRSLVYAGDSAAPGIFTVAAAGGEPVQLTTDADLWPSFTSDGASLLFVRDSSSEGSDFNAADPVDPVDDDLYELWSMAADGSGAVALAEGDHQTLAVRQPATTTLAGGETTPAGGAAVTVAKKGSRYTVRWNGTAAGWIVTLKVGRTTARRTVDGTVHAATFTLRKAKGQARAEVSAR